MGHNRLSCADVRGSCHVLEGVKNHQRPLKCHMIRSVASDNVKLPHQRRYLGVPSEPEHN